MVRKSKHYLQKYQNKQQRLVEEIEKGKTLIQTTTETINNKKAELEALEQLMTKEILIKHKMTVNDLADLLDELDESDEEDDKDELDGGE